VYRIASGDRSVNILLAYSNSVRGVIRFHVKLLIIVMK
jgi:hypothetical protein